MVNTKTISQFKRLQIFVHRVGQLFAVNYFDAFALRVPV
jgi:hypothetical protein